MATPKHGYLGLVLVLAMGLASPVSAQSTNRGPTSRADLITAAPERAQSDALDAETLDRVVTLLSGFEYFPSAHDLSAVVADPVPYLLVIAYDADGRWLPTHHHRAVAGLSYYPSAVTRGHLDYLLTSPHTPELMRHHVMNALANGFGNQALDALSPYLYDDDLQLRLTAVAAIGTIASDDSTAILQSALQIETHDLVQERIQRVLTSEPSAGSQLR